MKTKFRLSALTAAAGLLVAGFVTSCKDDLQTASEKVDAKGAARMTQAAAVDSVIGGSCVASTATPTSTIINTTRVLDGSYVLRNYLRVVPGGRLIIKPGTAIRGECRGTIVVERGGFIDARGTSTRPILMTSRKASGTRAPGDWGGLIVLGRAHNNQGGNVAIEGLTGTGAPSATARGYYGPGGASGNVTTYNSESSGYLQYLRIEYAGTVIGANNETNGLTLASVGSGTVVDHIQVLYGKDDGFEWFGGTVNARYLYSYNNTDDDFDTDFGFTGRIQFAVAVRKNLVDVAAASANGFESDNDATGSANLPKTNPRFANVTLVGPRCVSSPSPNFGAGILVRRSSDLDLYNSAIVNWGVGVNATGAGAGRDFKSVTVVNATTCFTPAGITGISCIGSTSWAGNICANCPTAPNLVPGSTSSLVTAGVTNPGPGFLPANYRGAFGSSSTANAGWNLTSGWLTFKCLGQ